MYKRQVVLLPIEFRLDGSADFRVRLREKIHNILDHGEGPPLCVIVSVREAFSSLPDFADHVKKTKGNTPTKCCGDPRRLLMILWEADLSAFTPAGRGCRPRTDLPL